MSGPLPGFLLPLTLPASWAYGCCVALRNRYYERESSVKHVGCPVISVGNVTAGGVGKTPFVRWIARLMLEHDRQPVIAMRGYGARNGEPSDEQAEHAQQLPRVDVLANPDRLGALSSYLIEHQNTDCVLLDDGFQHRQVHRDLNIVLIDATRSTLNDRLLPAGYLREPLGNLKRADAVIITHADSTDDEMAQAVERRHGKAPLAWSRHIWPHLRLFVPPRDEQEVGTDWLRGKKVLTMLGVGNPRPIVDQLQELGARITTCIPVRDHQRYTAEMMHRVRRSAEGAEALVVTGKDWVKASRLIDLEAWPVPIVVPALEIDIFSGAEALSELILATVHEPAR